MRCAEKIAAAYMLGRRDGYDAAREAVEVIPAPYKVRGQFETYDSYNEGRADFKDLAVAAIDALKERI